MLLICGDGSASRPLYDMFFRMGIITFAPKSYEEMPTVLPRFVLFVGGNGFEYDDLAARFPAPRTACSDGLSKEPRSLRQANIRESADEARRSIPITDISKSADEARRSIPIPDISKSADEAWRSIPIPDISKSAVEAWRSIPILDISGRIRGERLNTPMLLSEMNALLSEKGEPPLGCYSVGDVCADTEVSGIAVRGITLPATRSEQMLVRTLLAAHPLSLSAEELLRLAFIGSCTPERGAVRTHIFSINKKARAFIGEPLIVSTQGEGYRIPLARKAVLTV